MASDNPKEFWREIKRMKRGGSSGSKIGLSEFFEHFKDIFSNDEPFSSEFVEQFINQNLHSNVGNNGNEQHYDTSRLMLILQATRSVKPYQSLNETKVPD